MKIGILIILILKVTHSICIFSNDLWRYGLIFLIQILQFVTASILALTSPAIGIDSPAA